MFAAKLKIPSNCLPTVSYLLLLFSHFFRAPSYATQSLRNTFLRFLSPLELPSYRFLTPSYMFLPTLPDFLHLLCYLLQPSYTLLTPFLPLLTPCRLISHLKLFLTSSFHFLTAFYPFVPPSFENLTASSPQLYPLLHYYPFRVPFLPVLPRSL